MTTTDTPVFLDEQTGRSTFLRDTSTVFRRAMRISLRNPVWTVMGLLQPVLYLCLFGPLLEPIAGQLGADERVPDVRPRSARAARACSARCSSASA